jgi:hypothetical protein
MHGVGHRAAKAQSFLEHAGLLTVFDRLRQKRNMALYEDTVSSRIMTHSMPLKLPANI